MYLNPLTTKVQIPMAPPSTWVQIREFIITIRTVKDEAFP
jgi:hypothetical protein